MADWTKSMQQTFEFYEVDPTTWMDKRRIDTITSNSITYDSSSSTYGSASIETTEVLDECYIRTYLVVIQNGIRERFTLGTFLYQSPSISCDGKNSTISMDGYSPLIELTNQYPPIGLAVKRNDKIISRCVQLITGKVRAPHLIDGSSDNPNVKMYDDFPAGFNESILEFTTKLLSIAGYHYAIDPSGKIEMVPDQKIDEMQPSWTYTEDNSSILLPDVSIDKDIFDIPNVVEVLYSDSGRYYYAVAKNEDPNSITSIQNRGREIVYRTNSPGLTGVPSQAIVNTHAKTMLESASTLEYKITYSHGYCPVRVGDCVYINYERLGLINKKAKVISQEINCETGCIVSETAVYTEKLWEK